MNLLDNPFYVLGASPTDNKQRLSELAEEKSLLLEANTISEARSILMNPQKRLVAEIRWFPDASNETLSKILEYCNKVKTGIGGHDIKFLGLSELSILNYKLFEFQRVPVNGQKTAIESILEISILFEKVDAKTTIKQVNQGRIKSGFPPVIDLSKVEDEFQMLREEIKLAVATKLSRFTKEQYIEIATILAGKYAAPNDSYRGSAIISDILSDYKLKYAQEIADQKRKILQTVQRIKKNVSLDKLESEIKDLSNTVIIWDKLVQPIQLAARGEGKQEEDSDEVAYSIRDLAIELHNKHDQTALALELTVLLKDRFSELPEFFERIKDDNNTLQSINQEKEQTRKDENESLSRNRLDMRYSVNIHSDQVKIPPLCTCCMQPTAKSEKVSVSATQQHFGSKTTRTISLDMPICDDCLKHRRKTKKYTVLLLVLSLLTATFSIMLLANIKYAFTTLAYLPFIVAAAAFLILGFLIRLPSLDGEHSARQQSVWMGGIDMTGNEVTFTFTNWKYAQLFLKVNQVQSLVNMSWAKLKEEKHRNHAKSRVYLRTISNPVGLFLGAVSLVLVILLAGGEELESAGKRSPFFRSLAEQMQQIGDSRPKSSPQIISTKMPSTTKPETARTTNNKSKELAAPTDLNAEATASSVELTWKRIDGALKYNIYKSYGSNANYMKWGFTSTNTYTDKGITVGSTIYYKVTAYDGSHESEKSDYIKVIIPEKGSAQSVQATNSAKQTVTISPEIKNTPSPTSIFSLDDLKQYKTLKEGTNDPDVAKLKERMYELGYYRNKIVNNIYTADTARYVKEFQEVNKLPVDGVASPLMQLIYFSDYAKPKPPAKPKLTFPPNVPLTPLPLGMSTSTQPPTPKPTQLLIAPTGIKATVSESELIITWSAVLGVAKYQIHRSMSADGTFASIGTSSSTRFVDRNIIKGNKYYYKVVSVSGNNVSNYSAYVSASVPKPTVTPVKRTPTIAPRPTMLPNGKVTQYTSKKLEARLEITVPFGDEYYYILVKDSTTGQKVIAFIVYPGRTIEVKVPLGTYRIKYAIGKTWYGADQLFGEDTRYFEADKDFRFYLEGGYYYGRSIELIKQEGGNLETTPISEADFFN